MSSLSGFLNINKPHNWTSFDVVAKLRSRTGIRRIGHAGTLDPFATGVLVIALNRATLLVEYMQEKPKIYRGRIRLGQISDTDDIDGHKTTIPVSVKPNIESVRLTLARFTGEVEQVPPKYSALKVQGRRMYDLARKGLPVERKPRTVTISSLRLLAYSYPYVDIEARVSKGTYVRALARDIGDDLGTGGFLEELVRHSVGPLRLEEACSLQDISVARLPELLYQPSIAIDHLPRLILAQHELERLAMGQTVRPPNSLLKYSPKTVAVVNRGGDLLMLVEHQKDESLIKLKKLFDLSLAR